MLRMDAPVARTKPRLRGVFHEIGFYAAVGLGVPLVLTAEEGRPRLSAIVFASCLAGCFGASALYHRPTWAPTARQWLARLDHAGVYLLIAWRLGSELADLPRPEELSDRLEGPRVAHDGSAV